MISIGEFSRICQVSTKTLRYYAEIGLICPEEINPQSGYRYYTIDQLDTMILINKLKIYGLSLEEIKQGLRLEASELEQYLLMKLRKRKEAIHEQLQSYEMILQKLDQDMEKIKNGESIIKSQKELEIHLVEMGHMNLLSTRKIVTMEECEKGFNQFYDPLFNRVANDGLTIAYAPIAIYYTEGESQEGFDIEFAIPVKEYVTGTRDFDPGLCIKTVLEGPYTGLCDVYAKQRQWIEKEQYEVVKPAFEAYITDPYETTDPEDTITEIYLPVKKCR